MAKVISQETFDEVVQENIREFELSPEDAIADAREQFTAQAINLSNIVADPAAYREGASKHPIILAVEALSGEGMSGEAVAAALDTLAKLCHVDIAHRVMAGKHGAFPTTLQIARERGSESGVVAASLACLVALTDGQPDIMTLDGKRWLLEILDTREQPAAVLQQALLVVRQCCTQHEQNRQDMVASGVVPTLMALLDASGGEGETVRQVSACLRALTLDDDMRATFGKAHDHAQLIVTENRALPHLLHLCTEHKDSVPVLADLLSTVGKLAVRNEFCQEIVDLGGLQLCTDLLGHVNSQKLIVQVLNLVKAISGNDEVKDAAVKAGTLERILLVVEQHVSSGAVAEAGCGSVGALVLRKPKHADKVMEVGGGAQILQAMKVNADNARVQKQGCVALRNIISRNKQHVKTLLEELGAEDVIREAGQRHGETVSEEVKACLRDLGCEVELQIRWTGQGRHLEY